MKNILFSVALLFLVTSCIVEKEDSDYYRIFLTNGSTEVVSVKLYKEHTLHFTHTLAVNDSMILCGYVDDNYVSIDGCTDSIVVIFPNGKGYINTNTFVSNLNFQNNRHLFGGIEQGFRYLGDHQFSFTINSADYTNAHTLP